DSRRGLLLELCAAPGYRLPRSSPDGCLVDLALYEIVWQIRSFCAFAGLCLLDHSRDLYVPACSESLRSARCLWQRAVSRRVTFLFWYGLLHDAGRASARRMGGVPLLP